MYVIQGSIATILGSIIISANLSTVSVIIKIKDKDDDSVKATLLNTTYDFTADTDVTYKTINGGNDLTWDTSNYLGEYYVEVTLSHAELNGDREDKEQFSVIYPEMLEPVEPEIVEIDESIKTVAGENEEIEILELEDSL